MHLKRLIQSSNFDAAYEFFDNMREKGVACDIFDYSLMFLHTLYTSKEMFDFIESMDNDYNNVNIGTQNGTLISRSRILPAPFERAHLHRVSESVGFGARHIASQRNNVYVFERTKLRCG